MQAILAIPDSHTLNQHGGSGALMRKVCGVPLLVRVIKSAVRAGANSLLVLWPSDVPQSIWLSAQAALEGETLCGIVIVQREAFEPRVNANWLALSELFEDGFLWLPWNWVAGNRAMACRELSEVLPTDWSLPIRLKKGPRFKSRKSVLTSSPVGKALHLIADYLSTVFRQPLIAGLSTFSGTRQAKLPGHFH